MRVLLPIFAAGLLAQAPTAKVHAHPKSIAEKKQLLADLESKESKLKNLLHKEKELKTLEGKEKELKKLEEKKAKLEKLEEEKKELKTLEEKKAQLEKLEEKEKELKTLEEKKAKIEKLEEKEKELKTLEEKKAKLERLEGMEKELEEKKVELKTIEEKKAKLEAGAKAPEAEAQEAKAPEAKAPEPPSKNMDAAERLLKSLGQIKKLKGTFAADENFGGAMQDELSKGNTIWSAIEGLEAAAKSGGNGTTLAAAMNSFTSTMGKTLHAIDRRDEIQSEEYVLGLLAHHKRNATEQRRILSNFTNLHSVQDLLAEKPAPADIAAEYAGILDKEHPAAKPLTAFLQRVM